MLTECECARMESAVRLHQHAPTGFVRGVSGVAGLRGRVCVQARMVALQARACVSPCDMER